jgi:uncharacterized protein
VNLFSVNIVGLSLSKHSFEFELGKVFFQQYQSELVSEGTLKAIVELDKHETFIEAVFEIKGTVRLTCDRSLEEFDFPIATRAKLVYKYGDENKEISEEVVMIHRDSASLDLGQPMYEYITLAVPMKKLHPRFQEEEDDSEEGKLVYTSSDDSKDNDEDGSVDPRWEILKKLIKSTK